MKKTQERIRHISLVFSLCLFLFNFCSCGIESVTVLGEPYYALHTPNYESLYSESYFMFQTNEMSNDPDKVDNRNIKGFEGTEIYYKIYSDSSSMSSETNTLSNLANSETTSATSASRMIDSYGYKALGATNTSKNILIPKTDENKVIYVRLTDYQDVEAYSARILIGGENGTNITGTEDVAVPRRDMDDKELSFNFGRSAANAELNKVPVSSDSDVKYNSSTDDGKWYVAMFAVSVATNETYQKIYSNILYLGNVCIDSNSYNN